LAEAIPEKIEEERDVDYLLALGQMQGYVTFDDILSVLPEAEDNIEQLEEIFALLMSADIPVGDPEDVLQEAYLAAAQRIRHYSRDCAFSPFVWIPQRSLGLVTCCSVSFIPG